MKLKIAILVTAIAAITSSSFGQGVIFNGAANAVWFDATATPGVAVRSNNMAVAFLWNTSGATDPLSSAGANFAETQQAANKQTATNGIYTAPAVGASLASLFANGWRFATNNAAQGAIASVATGTTSGFSYLAGANFSVQGQANGTTYSFIVVAWNLSAGLTAIADGNVGLINAWGYSNPFLYVTGADSTSSEALFTGSGMNRFGVAPVPEPTTFALAGLGIASLLAFRRRK